MSLFPLALAIMAGGHSTRMGQDKAFLNDGRGPVLERLACMGLSLSLPVMIVGREQPANWPLSKVQFFHDAQPHQGPLGGLVAALDHAEVVICLACDYPGLEIKALSWLRDQFHNHTHGLVVSHGGGIEPLFAVYTQSCRSEAQRRLLAGERALHRLITACDIPHVAAPAWVVGQLQNINTPAEWEQFQLRQILKSANVPINGPADVVKPQ
jgi:molybdopterin-guanine dinucleotide biosynthesis protein A